MSTEGAEHLKDFNSYFSCLLSHGFMQVLNLMNICDKVFYTAVYFH